MFAITLTLEIDPKKIDAFVQAIQTNAIGSRQEPGCVRFDVNRDVSRPNFFAISELYRDEAAVQAHYDSPHFQAWRAAAEDEKFILSREAVRGPQI